jgi:putative hydrolase of the HAD superfamily
MIGAAAPQSLAKEHRMPRFETIAFDADDTLWHNERLYADAQEQFRELLAHYHSAEWIDERLYKTEMRNLEHFGYGIKAFALSMIETAVELTEGRISGADVQLMIDIARRMIAADVELLDHVDATIARLAGTHQLMVITKGDLRDQEAKIARSGLAAHFRQVEIVSDKSYASYAALLQRYAIAPERFLMVGNSLRSDILPVLELGASAVHIPYHLTWAHEVAEAPPADHPGFYALDHLGQLPALLEQIEG